MTSFEIRRRALRAAAAVTFGVAMAGCTGSVVDSSDQGGDVADEGNQSSTATTSTIHVPQRGSSSGDAQEAGGGGAAATTASAGGAMANAGGNGAGGDAGVDCRKESNGGQDWQAYTKCCDAVNWDFAAGCEAWGPPMPPSMDWSAKAVA